MKLSKYNILCESLLEKNSYLAYNSRTNALATVEKDKMELLLRNKDNITGIEDKEFLSQLKKGGYVVGAEANELDDIKYLLYKSRYTSKGLSLTIAPTMSCNFACEYCFEKDFHCNSKMDQIVQNRIIDLIQSQVKNLDSVHVTWFGGEPLLEMKAIEEMSVRIIDICRKANIGYSANIITNGYLLNSKNSKRLSELNVNSVQVTLDGTKEVHDKMRPLVNGGNTFDKIMENLAAASEYFNGISVRINIDKLNKNNLREIFELVEIESIKDRLILNLGRITSSGDCGIQNSCLNIEGFSEVDLGFRELLKEYGHDVKRNNSYPVIKGNYCGADMKNSYVIGPKGDLYKCWMDLGNGDRTIGNMLDDNLDITSNKVYFDYMMYDPTDDKHCVDCNLLSVCMGGCGYSRLMGQERCSTFKYNFVTRLQNIEELVLQTKEV